MNGNASSERRLRSGLVVVGKIGENDKT